MSDVSPGLSAIDFMIWGSVVTAVLGVGMGAIAAAYYWPTGTSVVFPTAIASASALPTSVEQRFQRGCEAYQARKFRQATYHFSEVLAAAPSCAEAFHNRGLALANLGDDQAALQNLLRASDLYDQQGDKAGLDQIKQSLETLRRQRSHSTHQNDDPAR